MSATALSMLLLSVMMMSGLVLTKGLPNLSPSYSYYPDYGDDYDYYDQSSSTPILSIKTVLVNESFTVDCLVVLDKEEQLQLVHNGQQVQEDRMEEQLSGEERKHSFCVSRAALTDSGK